MTIRSRAILLCVCVYQYYDFLLIRLYSVQVNVIGILIWRIIETPAWCSVWLCALSFAGTICCTVTHTHTMCIPNTCVLKFVCVKTSPLRTNARSENCMCGHYTFLFLWRMFSSVHAFCNNCSCDCTQHIDYCMPPAAQNWDIQSDQSGPSHT